MISKIHRVCLVVICTAFLPTQTVLADDGLTPGPGIFTGEKGVISLTGLVRGSAGNTRQNSQRVMVDDASEERDSAHELQQVPTLLPNNEVTANPLTTGEFAAYKEWRQQKFKIQISEEQNFA